MALKRKKSVNYIKNLGHAVHTARFAQRYLIFAVVILSVTTLFWSIIGSLIHLANADQLVGSYLMQNTQTFQGAIFPDQHTFLLKLPLFLFVHLLGSSPFAFCFVTVLTVLLTVSGLAYIIYRIEKRPLVLGTILLALAACLMMVPAQPFAGGLLPVNMAMIATRNIEYVLYIVGLALIIRAKSYRSRSFAVASLMMVLLIASDKLFLSLSLGGALLALVTYLIARRKSLISISLRWLAVSLIGFAGATVLLFILNWTGLMHISSPAGAGPYGLIHSVKDFVTGLVYGVASIFTNFGANPAFDIRIIKDMPRQVLMRLFSPLGISFVVTLAVTLASLVATYKIWVKSITKKTTVNKNKPRHDITLALMLIWTSVAACGAFVVSNHYYPVDARYEAIVLFAGFISLTSFVSRKRIPTIKLVAIGSAMSIGILISIAFVFSTLNASKQALSDVNSRNNLVAQVLKARQINTLVGDYWRVMPIRLASHKNLTVTPMADCSTARDVLTSQAWKPSLINHSFAYLLTLDGSVADFPRCSLQDITSVYGKPSASTLIEGTIDNPQELLLIYEQGIVRSRPQTANSLDTVNPVALDRLIDTGCSQPTLMSFVAHEDDDILFMNPDLLHTIKSGYCVRTIYFTAGDAGSDEAYWLGRQKGAEAAYSTMLGKPGQSWIERIIALPGGQFVTVANPKGDKQISLIFLHMPDGGLQGMGFARTHHESLQQLYTGRIPIIKTVDNSSTYNSTQLTANLIVLMQTYQPSEIRSQSSSAGEQYKDHSDHTNVAHYTTDAYKAYLGQHPTITPSITYYIGYPIHSQPANLEPNDIVQKTRAFLAYGKFDGASCHEIEICYTQGIYGIYLQRQYTKPY